MARKRLLFAGLAALAIAAAGAGLSLAQNPPANSLAGPPPEAAPPPPPAAQNVQSQPAASGPASAPLATGAPASPPAEAGNQTGQDDSNVKADGTSEEKPAPAPVAGPPKRPRYTTAVLQALDKVTAETLRFEAKVNEPVRYKDLVVTVHACESNASDEPVAESAAHMDVLYQPDVLPTGGGARTARRIFRGWMFANAPGLHPLQHPIYDLWVIACRTPSPASPPLAGGSL